MPPAAESSTRATPRWLLASAVALLAARVALEAIAGGRPARVEDHVGWRPIETAPEEARIVNKPILYDFTAEWCPPCRKMQEEVFADRRSAQAIEGLYVPVRVLDRQREEGRNPPAVAAVQARYAIQAFPTLVIVDPVGGPPVRIEGYASKDDLMKRLVAAGVEARLRRGMPPTPTPGSGPVRR